MAYNATKDLPEDIKLPLDDYELHILWRAVRLYIAVNGVEEQEFTHDPLLQNENNPDLHGVREMTARAGYLRDKVDAILRERA